MTQSQSSEKQSAYLTNNATMKEPTTSGGVVSSAVKRAVNRIIGEDEGMMNGGSNVNEDATQNIQVARPMTKHPRPLSSSITTTSTICSVLEELSSPQQWGEIVTPSSNLYVYSNVLLCAAFDEWGAASVLLLLGAFLEMMYEFRPERVLAMMKQQPTKPITESRSRKELGERSAFSSSVNISSDKATSIAPATMKSSIDGLALVHEAELFVRAYLTNDDPVSKPSNVLAFVLQKLPEQWIDRTYERIGRYVQRKPVEVSLVRVIMRNASSLEEESCYRVSSNWTVDMILGVFISQAGHGHKTFQFLLPSPNKRDYTDYSIGSKSRIAKEIGSSTLQRLIAKGQAEIVIYYDAILAPHLLV